MELIVMIVWFANDRRRWDEGCPKAAEGEGGGELSDGRSESASAASPPSCWEAEACGVGLRGVWVLERHLG